MLFISVPSLPQCDGAGDDDESMELDADDFNGKCYMTIVFT